LTGHAIKNGRCLGKSEERYRRAKHAEGRNGEEGEKKTPLHTDIMQEVRHSPLSHLLWQQAANFGDDPYRQTRDTRAPDQYANWARRPQ
jgi:hypothetical protein